MIVASAFKRVLAIDPKNGKSTIHMTMARKMNPGVFSSEEPKINSPPTKASPPSRIPAPIHNLACSRRVSDTLLCVGVVSIPMFVLLSVILILI